MKKIILFVLSLLLLPEVSTANGFDASYQAYRGDFNADGLTDVYVKGSRNPFVSIVIDDLSIVIPIATAPGDFVLLQRADHGMTVQADLTVAQRATLAGWPRLNITLKTGDVNTDGADDLYIAGLQAITGAFDQIVFSPTTRGKPAPLSSTSVDRDFIAFFNTVLQWLHDSDSLIANEFKIVANEPAAKTWIAAFPTSNPSPNLVAVAFSLCPSGTTCGISTSKPTPCLRPVNNYDELGNFLGVTTTDVCQRALHLWSYAPGTIRLVRNEGYHQAAVDFTRAVNDVIDGRVTDFRGVSTSLSLFNAYLGAVSPLGSEQSECSDAPGARSVDVAGFAQATIPILAACAAVSIFVIAGGADRLGDLIGAISDNVVFSGRARVPAPHSHQTENEAIEFKQNPFGGECDPPAGNGNLRNNIKIIREQLAWRRTDLNFPIDGGDRNIVRDAIKRYADHRIRIKILEAKLKSLEATYRALCGGEP